MVTFSLNYFLPFRVFSSNQPQKRHIFYIVQLPREQQEVCESEGESEVWVCESEGVGM